MNPDDMLREFDDTLRALMSPVTASITDAAQLLDERLGDVLGECQGLRHTINDRAGTAADELRQLHADLESHLGDQQRRDEGQQARLERVELLVQDLTAGVRLRAPDPDIVDRFARLTDLVMDQGEAQRKALARQMRIMIALNALIGIALLVVLLS